MPKPFTYKSMQPVSIEVTVVNGDDVGNPIVDIGGFRVAVPRECLDRADIRPASERPLTAEEYDLAKQAEDREIAAEALRASRRAARAAKKDAPEGTGQ